MLRGAAVLYAAAGVLLPSKRGGKTSVVLAVVLICFPFTGRAQQPWCEIKRAQMHERAEVQQEKGRLACV